MRTKLGKWLSVGLVAAIILIALLMYVNRSQDQTIRQQVAELQAQLQTMTNAQRQTMSCRAELHRNRHLEQGK